MDSSIIILDSCIIMDILFILNYIVLVFISYEIMLLLIIKFNDHKVWLYFLINFELHIFKEITMIIYNDRNKICYKNI